VLSRPSNIILLKKMSFGIMRVALVAAVFALAGASPRQPRTGDCIPGMYMCEDSLCIPNRLVCDGFYDCTTMDDEENCNVTEGPTTSAPTAPPTTRPPTTPVPTTPAPNCNQFQFECSNGHCIPAESVCNGVSDCSSGEDEYYCTRGREVVEEEPTKAPCNMGMYRCDDSLCIPQSLVCDGFYDCTTMDDEADCPK